MTVARAGICLWPVGACVLVSPDNHVGRRVLLAGRTLLTLGTSTSFRQSNFLRSSLHPILEELGIEHVHSFRRFRVTHLESSYVPSALVK